MSFPEDISPRQMRKRKKDVNRLIAMLPVQDRNELTRAKVTLAEPQYIAKVHEVLQRRRSLLEEKGALR